MHSACGPGPARCDLVLWHGQHDQQSKQYLQSDLNVRRCKSCRNYLSIVMVAKIWFYNKKLDEGLARAGPIVALKIESLTPLPPNICLQLAA